MDEEGENKKVVRSYTSIEGRETKVDPSMLEWYNTVQSDYVCLKFEQMCKKQRTNVKLSPTSRKK